jgi:hypothetical protein
MCYNRYEIQDDLIIIKKSNDYFSSIIKVRELTDIFYLFKKEKDIEISILRNEDITLKKIRQKPKSFS